MTDSPEAANDLQTLEALATLETTIQNAHQRLEQLLATVQDYEGAQDLLQELRQGQAAMATTQQYLSETADQLQVRQVFLERSTHQAQEVITRLAPLMAKIEALAGIDAIQEQLQAIQQALETNETKLERSKHELQQSVAADLQPLAGQIAHLRTLNKRLTFAVIAIGVIALIGLLT
jgi:chromosome segregation ATPase